MRSRLTETIAETSSVIVVIGLLIASSYEIHILFLIETAPTFANTFSIHFVIWFNPGINCINLLRKSLHYYHYILLVLLILFIFNFSHKRKDDLLPKTLA